MKIATILPTKHLYIEDRSDYHLCLAHHVCEDLTYTFFFRRQVRRGAFVMLDNGAAENGVPMEAKAIAALADMIGCNEIVLPDTIYKKDDTLRLSHKAIQIIRDECSLADVKLMAVPQGDTPLRWKSCLIEMLSWGVDTIGISKFIAPKLFPSRLQALLEVPILLESKCDIHLLGYTGVEGEISAIDTLIPNRIRGIDSSIATLYAHQHEMLRDRGRPDIPLDLNAELEESWININVRRWKKLCMGQELT